AVGAAIAVFALLTVPILSYRRSSGSCEAHVIALGLMTNFTEVLGIGGAPYDWGHLYHDMYAYETITTFAHRATPGLGSIDYCSHAYDTAGAAYLLTVARTFPA